MPSRRCVSCGREGEKTDFLRMVRTPDGNYVIDRTGRMNGRGAYLCRDEECRKAAIRKRSFNRSFRTAIPAEVYEALREESFGGEEDLQPALSLQESGQGQKRRADGT